MIFPELFAEQFNSIKNNPNFTRSNKILVPVHLAIANIASAHTSYQVISLPKKEFEFKSIFGNKKIDIAIVDEKNALKGAIMFKGIRSEYNKNANNYYENMKGESSLFIENNIPVYQVVFIPTQIKHGDGFEAPTQQSYLNYYNFINHHSSYWNKLKLGVFYFDITFKDDRYTASYSNKTISGVENNLSQGIINFMKEVNANG